jgi:hypothetical protein
VVTGLLWTAVGFFALGPGFYKLFDDAAASGLTVVGLVIFVIVAWRGARPEQGGEVGRPDINPWSVG